MQPGTFVLKGDICYNTSPHDVRCVSQGYVVCQKGISAGVFDELPHEFAAYPCIDCGSQLIIPGLCDLHLHAPQYSFRGLGMDLELLEWLTTHIFSEEARYAELSYARRAYTIFADALQASPTTRAIIFGTQHVPATEYLMDALEATGLETYVGKVSMDRNSPEYLCETTAESVHRTITWPEDIHGRYTHTHPIITPRFTPSCSDELRAELGRIRAHYHLPVQSHLSENISEVAWVKELCPDSDSYGDTYARWGLFGMDDGLKTVMAHAVYSSEAEVEVLRATGIYVAHCPQSNAQLASGIAPIWRYIDAGIAVGLGTDIAGGSTQSMFRSIADAIAASKLRWRLVDEHLAPLTTQEALWLATAGGGSFFGRVGSLAKNYEFDVLVLDDSGITTPRELSVWERVERYLFLSEEGGRLMRKYVAGHEITLS